MDDTEANIFVMEGLLKKLKVEYDIEKSGREANESVKSCNGNYKLILMDYYMPDMTGLEATKEIKKIYPHLHIILLTAESSEDVSDEIKNTFEAIVSKPITFIKLKKILEKYTIV